LKLKFDNPLSSFAFNFNLRRFILGPTGLLVYLALKLVWPASNGVSKTKAA
jgi:hypothetical protein